MARRTRILVLALSAAAFAPAWGTTWTNRYPATHSFAPGATATYGAVNVVVAQPAHKGGTVTVQWSAAALGVPANGNIDAFSDGTDILPDPTEDCPEILVEYTVDPASLGSGSLVTVEQTTDNAHSDIFGSLNTLPDPFLVTDHMSIPIFVDLDALAWAEMTRYPVYFSVDGPTAALMGVSAADILVQNSPGAVPTCHVHHTALGLEADDDIDGLAVDGGIQVVFSLAPGSPAFGPGKTFDGRSPADVLDGAGVWRGFDAAKLGLLTDDNVNGVRISDPQLGSLTGASPSDGTEIDPASDYPWDTLTVDGSAGNTRHTIPLKQSFGHIFGMNTLKQGDVLYLFVHPGKACLADAVPFPLAQTLLSFAPAGPPIFIGPTGQSGLSIPFPQGLPPLVVTFQGIVANPTGTVVHTTNSLRLSID